MKLSSWRRKNPIFLRRVKKNLTKLELAKLAKVRFQFIEDVERGDASLVTEHNFEKAVAIAYILDTNAPTLINEQMTWKAWDPREVHRHEGLEEREPDPGTTPDAGAVGGTTGLPLGGVHSRPKEDGTGVLEAPEVDTDPVV